ncbi:hypothetical protein [Desulfotruncus alcoholivorax]|uniref:hypothetical protein n=1 Tax=Desulfotruncus alcoholivorax TaxID=265477 RepID=UPI0003F7DCF5|nr:hypothetical protein [Desulfotruncus alcoholivorax]
MRKNMRVLATTGTIVKIDVENGLIGVSDALGHVTNYNITPSNLFDTDGSHILIDDLRPGDRLLINGTGYRMMMKVMRAAICM